MLKKFLIILTVFSFTSAANAVGLNIGVSGVAGGVEATGTETEATGKEERTIVGAIAYASVFAEFQANDIFAVGVDYVPQSLESDTVEEARADLKGKTAGASSTVNNNVQVDFDDYITAYIRLNVTENLYVKAGVSEVEMITNESLGTGSKYANATLDGNMVGFGYDKDLDNGVFVRLEASYFNFDGTKLTSSTNSDNTVEIDEINGVAGRISLGKSF